ncbi:iron-sulfur cluster-binding domain-containing protein [Antrihabitans cavernicola]|nr:iron-sulfur cluster-binding domain-containing protein [Spelaeibacter cavernicola]
MRAVMTALSRVEQRLPGRGMFGPAPITIARPNGPAKRWSRGTPAATSTRVRVVSVVHETADAVTLVLQTVDGRPVPYRAGQYLTHCFPIDGSVVKRAYSISEPEGGRLACTVKCIEGGVVSGFVASRIAIGYEYTVLGPSGDFVMPEDPRAPLAFLAAGSGITPVISMIETALHRDTVAPIRLVYAARSEPEAIFASRLAALAIQNPHLSVFMEWSRSRSAGGAPGRLTGEQAANSLSAGAATHVFLCGPTALMDATATALHDRGLPAQQIHRERFYPAPRHTQHLPAGPQTLRFASSNATVSQRPGETILDAGLRHGVRLDFSCTVGGCAACKVRVLDGNVTVDEPNCLTAEERADGFVLACSAYALDSTTIDA